MVQQVLLKALAEELSINKEVERTLWICKAERVVVLLDQHGCLAARPHT
jgi:hypothetical protein